MSSARRAGNAPIPLLLRGSGSVTDRIGTSLRTETVGGALLLVATVFALAWANSPWSDRYHTVMKLRFGPAALHLDLTVATWAADGLLAIFFFVVGLELKREFVAGDLRDPARGVLPIAAAIGGIAVPGLVFILFNLNTGDGALRGWAIPVATDAAFAVPLLAVVSTHLPASVRTFLLTLAVVDDLLAVTTIAVFYAADVNVAALGLTLIPLGLFTIAVQRRIRSGWLLVPLAAATWALMHASGMHATVAGVLLGFAVPVLPGRAAGDPETGSSMAEYFERRVRPLSAGIAVPLFAFCAAGVTVGGLSGLGSMLGGPIAMGIVTGLVVGKTVGILGATYLLSRFTRASLAGGMTWLDVLGIGMLGGVGFTVSLLIGELAFGIGTERNDQVKVGVLAGSLIAAAIGAAILHTRNRHYRRLREVEERDARGEHANRASPP
jgi:NhaA family Na+:H+ antiporter